MSSADDDARRSARQSAYSPPWGDYLDFTPADLDANRTGVVTDSQQQRLRGMTLKNVGIMTALAVILFITTNAFIGVNVGSDEPSGLLTLLVVIMAVSGVALVGRAVYETLRFAKDHNRRQVAQVTGPVTVTQSGPQTTEQFRSRYTRFGLHVAGRTFRIPYEAYVVLEDGSQHTIYYETTTGELLSLE